MFKVFNQAAETTRCLFVEFVPNKVTSSEVARCVDRLLPELLAKSGDASVNTFICLKKLFTLTNLKYLFTFFGN